MFAHPLFLHQVKKKESLLNRVAYEKDCVSFADVDELTDAGKGSGCERRPLFHPDEENRDEKRGKADRSSYCCGRK